ncbi:LPXTG cell wall anchor domain-containing protein [Dactylosporangium sp. NPDC000555]|uniref:LPXTG cell wall anchor domain-containing protein n=1 Tax=Dactylosporangium sp. NPDC000555 TaxID=3154260 RepID=UPI00332BAE68
MSSVPARVRVRVDQPDPGRWAPPKTGSNITPYALVGVGALTAGVVLLLLIRRRRRPQFAGRAARRSGERLGRDSPITLRGGAAPYPRVAVRGGADRRSGGRDMEGRVQGEHGQLSVVERQRG